MKKAALITAALLFLGGLGIWLGKGAHTGWTQTSVPVKALDEVTGIESITYEDKFLPGIDFLGAMIGGAVVLGAVSAFIKNKPKHQAP